MNTKIFKCANCGLFVPFDILNGKMDCKKSLDGSGRHEIDYFVRMEG